MFGLAGMSMKYLFVRIIKTHSGDQTQRYSGSPISCFSWSPALLVPWSPGALTLLVSWSHGHLVAGHGVRQQPGEA